MMFTTLAADSRKIVRDARELARELEAPAVEAEHLLLAVARAPGTATYDLLGRTGLDYERAREALDAEFEDTLASVGIVLNEFELTAASSTPRTPRWGTSAKLALQRSAKLAVARHDRRITPAHILLGILRASAGTVPRALDRAGIDRANLSRQVSALL
ncbi:MAG: Clp protease N-terminal domain-containing protein [Gaiellales bacterium]